MAWEADRILKYQLIPIKDGDNPLAWDVEGPEFPNVTLTASRISGAALHESRLDLAFDRDLRVTLAPTHPVVGPGEEVELEVTTRDQLGRPVAAEVALAMVDRALLSRFGEHLPPIRSVFYNQSRTGAFATRSTNTFRYTPTATAPARGADEPGPREFARCADPSARGLRARSDRSPARRPGAIKIGKDARSQAILKILDEPINMPFANETPLEDVLKYIKQATTTEQHPGLPIYVDPIGLQEAERSMNSRPCRSTWRTPRSGRACDWHSSSSAWPTRSRTAS